MKRYDNHGKLDPLGDFVEIAGNDWDRLTRDLADMTRQRDDAVEVISLHDENAKLAMATMAEHARECNKSIVASCSELERLRGLIARWADRMVLASGFELARLVDEMREAAKGEGG